MQNGKAIERDTFIRINLKTPPRKFTTSILFNPRVTGFTAKVNGVTPSSYGNIRIQSGGIPTAIPWTSGDLNTHGVPEIVELTIDVLRRVGELREMPVRVEVTRVG